MCASCCVRTARCKVSRPLSALSCEHGFCSNCTCRRSRLLARPGGRRCACFTLHEVLDDVPHGCRPPRPGLDRPAAADFRLCDGVEIETAQTRAAAADGARQAPRKTAGLRLRWWRRAHPAAEAVAGPLRRRQSRHVQTVDYEELHLPPGRRRPRRAAPEKSLARGPPAWRTARQPSPAYLAMAGPA